MGLKHSDELNRQEALEAAISERDAQLGLLEVSGIKTARAAERADDLRADRKRLMEMMKQQNEKRVKLLLEYEDLPPEGLFRQLDDDSSP